MISKFYKSTGLMLFIFLLSLFAVCGNALAEGEEITVSPEAQNQNLPDLSASDIIWLQRSTVQLQRQYVVAAAMKLTEKEGKDFWPIYSDYWAEMNVLREGLLRLVEDFSEKHTSLSEEDAALMIREYLSIREAEINLRQKYLKDFAAVLPHTKVMRYYQIENKLDAVIAYEITKAVPLATIAEEQGQVA